MKLISPNMTAISGQVKPFLAEYFQSLGMIVRDMPEDLFAECIRLESSEVSSCFQPEHQSLFDDDTWFQAASGDIEVLANGGPQEYTVMLLMDEGQAEAFFLFVQPVYDNSGDMVLVKDFRK